MKSQFRLSIARTLVAAALVASAPAQVGPGEFVVSTFFSPGSTPGPGGLWIVNASTNAVTPVTGLGPELTGSGSPTFAGANCVLIGPGGELYVGELGPMGTDIHLHVITLSGSAVVSDRRIYVGTEASPFGGGISQMALLPDGRVLVSVFLMGAGPLDGFGQGIVDPVTEIVVGMPVVTGQQPGGNALCLGPGCDVAYFCVHNGGGTSNLFSVPIPGGGQATLIATLCSNASNLMLDRPRNVLVATGINGNCAGNVIEIDLATSAVSTCAVGLGALNALAPDGAGGLFIADAGGGSALYTVPSIPGCAAFLLTNGPPSGWGVPSGIAADFGVPGGTLFSDDFESGGFGAGGWDPSGSSVKRKAGVDRSFGAELKSTASIEVAIDTTGLTGIEVSYARSTTGLDNGERLVVEWSIDGTNWNLIESIEDTPWAAVNSFDLVGVLEGAEDNCGFRVRFTTNADRNNEKAFVDNVEVTGV